MIIELIYVLHVIENVSNVMEHLLIVLNVEVTDYKYLLVNVLQDFLKQTLLLIVQYNYNKIIIIFKYITIFNYCKSKKII